MYEQLIEKMDLMKNTAPAGGEEESKTEAAPAAHRSGDKLGTQSQGVMDDVVSTFNEINNMKTITQRLKQSNIRHMAQIKRSYSKT